MPYIGKNPVGGGFHKLDALTASATDTYALTLGSAAYYPESANQLLVSLNGVIQAPQDSFTVSGSNLVFDTALTASDSIDFVVALGDVLAVQTVTDGAITTAKLGNSAVTDAKIDTMAASKLTGTIDDARMPAGSVVQTVFSQYSTQTSITSTTAGSGTSTGVEVQITPHSSTNKLLIQADLSIAATAYVPNTSISLEVYDGSSVVYQEVSSTYFHNASGDENYYTRGTVQAFINAHSGAKTYTVRAFKGATGTVVAQPNSNLSSILIQEIKQ